MIADLDKAHIELVLLTKTIGHLACCAEGRPYVVPITYVYQDGYVYGHTNEGMKLQMIRKNPQVCLAVDDIDSTVSWRSVIAWGTFEELEGEEAAKGFDILFSRLAPIATSATSMPPDSEFSDRAAHDMRLKTTKGVIYRIFLREKTGRFERK